jgi:hypothetical protein
MTIRNGTKRKSKKKSEKISFMEEPDLFHILGYRGSDWLKLRKVLLSPTLSPFGKGGWSRPKDF